MVLQSSRTFLHTISQTTAFQLQFFRMSNGLEGILLGGAIVAVLLATATWWLVTLLHRRMVAATSFALDSLVKLNATFAPDLKRRQRIRLNFNTRVNTKAKLDRYDLQAHLRECLFNNEYQIATRIEEMLARLATYSEYCSRQEELGTKGLGCSHSDRLTDERYRNIEKQLFFKRVLRAPRQSARVRVSVSYTSPKGRNSYERHLTLSFDQLRDEFEVAKKIRARQNTTVFLRQQERNKVTMKIRAQVMARDGYRCRHCGVSPNHDPGVVLHVDHITPISKGGKSDLSNLQTLCQDCNLGKGAQGMGFLS